MDIFRNLQSSLATQWEQAFDHAYHDLTTEIRARDARVKQLEKEIELLHSSRRDDHARIRDLEDRIILLEDDPDSNDTIEKEERDTVKQKVSELQRTYDPDRQIGSVRNAHSCQNNSDFYQALEPLEVCYRALYDETRTLLDVTGSLRAQVKRNKHKLAQWSRWRSPKNQTVITEKVERDHRKSNGRRIEEGTRFDSSNSNESVLLPAPRPTSPGFLQGATDGESNLPGAHDKSAASTLKSTEGVMRRSPSLPQSKQGPGSTWPRSKQGSDDEGNRVPMSKMLGSEPSSTQSEDSMRNHDDYHSVPMASIHPAGSSVPEQKIELSKSCNRWQDKPNNIKSEALSSSPVLNTLVGLEVNPSGTEDLDDVGDSVRTPKKQSFTVFEERFCPPSLEGSTEIFGEQRRVLQPKDNNQKAAEPSCRSPYTKRRKTSDRGAAAIPRVTEDGEDAHYDLCRKNQYARFGEARSPGASPRNTGAYRRLDDLLQAPSPLQRQLLRQGPTNSTAGPSPNMSNAQNGYTGKERLHPSSSRIASGMGIHTSLQMNKSHRPGSFPIDNSAEIFSQDDGRVWEEVIREVPYRERPIDLLHLGCFKLNSERNEGLDFAFQDVVRNPDQRKCLPGCMRADCCGDKFRAMVRAGGIFQFEEKDRTLLEEYLGDQKHIIDEVDVEARNDLLIEATARVLADRFGRHKHAHGRPRSPPGFWRTDMPTTQELERDRKEADQLEREKIKGRYREAMRPGGLWKFADE